MAQFPPSQTPHVPPQSTPVSPPFCVLSLHEAAAVHRFAVHVLVTQSLLVSQPEPMPQGWQSAPPQSMPVSSASLVVLPHVATRQVPAWQTVLAHSEPALQGSPI